MQFIITLRVTVHTVDELRRASTNLANASTPLLVARHSLSAILLLCYASISYHSYWANIQPIGQFCCQ